MKILASDYDGTLRRGNGISDTDRRAIEEFRRDGNRFGIVTGRGHAGFLHELERVNFEADFLICNNGAVIFEGDRLIDRVYADGALLQTLIPYIISVGARYAAITVDTTHYFTVFGDYAGAVEGSRTAEDDFIRADHLDRVARFNQVDCNIGSDKSAAEFAEQVNLRYGKWLNAFNNGSCVDIVPKAASKPNGILRYIQSISVDKKDVLTVGDNFNDIGMLIEFGGYVMETGHAQVIQAVGRTCRDMVEAIEILMKRP